MFLCQNNIKSTLKGILYQLFRSSVNTGWKSKAGLRSYTCSHAPATVFPSSSHTAVITIPLSYVSFTVIKFEISQSQALSTVLTSCDIKSLTWYGKFYGRNCDGKIPSSAFSLRFGEISGAFGVTKIWAMARPNSPDMPPKLIKKALF